MAMAAAERLLTNAAEHYNAGRAGEAGALCGDILSGHPDYLPALHLAAVIAFSEGRMSEGSALLGRVFARDPNHAPAYVTLGDALAVKGEREGAMSAFLRAVTLRPKDAGLHAKLGTALFELSRYEDAEAAYRHALTLDPNLSRARCNLGITLAAQRKFADAEQVFRRLLMGDPAYPGAWRHLANALADQDKFDEAVVAYLNALSTEPDDVELHIALGNVLYKQSQFDDAAVHYRRAIALAPNDVVPMRLLGHALHEAGRAGDAVEAYQKAALLDPRDVVISSNLGACLCGLGQFDAAIAACERALALHPDHAPAHTNLGIIYEKMGNADAAVAAHRRALAADPGYARGYANLAVALRNRGDLDEMLEMSRQAVALAPDDALTRYNHAHFLLICGYLAEGFAEHQWGRKCKHLAPEMPVFEGPEWQGENFAGKTLLLFAEYGIGDALQFVRYVPMVTARGGTVVLQVQPAIAALLRPMQGVVVLGRDEPVPHYDLQLPLMDLPRIFGTTLDTIPVGVPYLKADPVKVEAWRAVLGNRPALKVGVVWAGSPLHKGDQQRSLTAEAVLPRLVVPGVQLFSLQKEPRPADKPVLQRLAGDIIDLAPRLGDFTDTAAAVAALDLVISVDTSVAHLAGALGRPCWVLLPHALDWRWLRDREDTPWYPTMRLFRQSKPQAWDGVLAHVSVELELVASGQRELLLPPAPDEVKLHIDLGNVLCKQRKFNDAVVHYRRATELAPDNVAALRLLGTALYDAGRVGEAVEIYRRASVLDPSDVVILSNLSACLTNCEQFEAATAACEEALALDPDFAPAHVNLGIIHEKMGNVDASVAAHRRAISADPDFAPGYANLAVALRNKGELDEMLEVSHQAVRLAPDNAQIRFGHAHVLLMCGDLVNGFAEYQWGHKYGLSEGTPRFDGPEWQGEDFAGKTLLIFAEYGIGDALHFVRYMPMVVARGGSVLLQVQPAIAALLRPMPGVTVLGRHEPVPHYDLQLPLMDLPRIFGTTLDTIPADIPYLKADSVKVEKWREALGDQSTLKVGVVWAGSPLHKGDRQRSLSAEAVLPRLVRPGVQLFSLQKEPRPADMPVLEQLAGGIIDLAPLLGDFTDTAAAVSALDLVISVDTSVAHLAGALGRPCWMLLPYAVDWRWLRDREDSPWYPTMRLFRQSQPQAWDGVLARASAELARVVAGERELLLPRAAGL
ncbi:tetratricopeptide repeat protein [Bradyrhizobium sp. STM 3557]|uniref:tetratricopeptide repeat protein n=1 Tax=Bradyrhizobium sp. STM 3557 TaxID=578920 RepID=UPI00388E2D2E